MTPFDTVGPLREAVRLSPENAPLRRHLGETLLRAGLASEAVDELRQALTLAPADNAVRLALATAFHQLGQHGEALVIVEALTAPDAGDNPAAHVLAARVLLATGAHAEAAGHYHTAVRLDPETADEDLDDRLGRAPTSQAEQDPAVVGGQVRLATDGRGEFEPDEERPQLSLDDVGGMQEVKEELRIKILLPLQHPELYRAYGKEIGGGILMYGPPGCGKTHLARATAGEAGIGFVNVGLEEILDMWIGSSERNLHDVFQRARRSAPCVLFFDEVDALGARRSDMRGAANRQVINQFLTELDGAKHRNEGVLVLGATNAPWHMDPAFRRPGRFGQVLFVPPPDQPARTEILRGLCRGKPVGTIDHDHLAGRTDGYSGADLKAIVERAVEEKFRAAVRSGRLEPLTTRDLTAAAKRVKPSTREWFQTARNHAVHANESGTYDDVLRYMDQH